MSKLRNTRRDCGLTMRFIAEAVGVSEASISRIERGFQNPPVDLAIKISKTLDGRISPEEVMMIDEKLNLYKHKNLLHTTQERDNV